MKMKKLTALALAGVLCLGMSTTAFAAASPLPEDAVTATQDGKELGVVDQTPIKPGNTPLTFKGWDSKEPEEVNKSVRHTFEDRLTAVNRELDDKGSLTGDRLDELNAEKENLENLLKAEEDYVVVSLAELTPPAGADPSKPLTVRFDLAWEGIEEGQPIRIIHKVGNDFAIYDDLTVQRDKFGKLYVEAEFEDFSPVAILRFATPTDDDDKDNNNGNTTTPPTNPGDDTTVTPGTNGNITADQLADLIVKRLQQNADASKVVRVVSSSKASPKTGE